MLVGTKTLDRIASRVGIGAAKIVASLRSPEPVAIGFTPGFATTMRAAAAPHPYYIGDRPRLATCGFFPDGRNLVVTDQAADTASIIAFDSKTGGIGERRLTIQNPWGRLSFPHGNAVSPDGRHLAVANYGDDKVTIYKMSL